MALVDSSTCLELALEGERLCKAGDCRAGVAFFEAAIQAGTDDLRTLSAIYSQLGNAYFYLGDYVKAMQYHRHDLTLARTMGDKLGEAKASGNLGNTLKVMGKFDEAVICCRRHLDISRELHDRVGEGRALYNLGNVYHAKGKHLGRLGQQDPGEFPEEVKVCLLKAVEYYEENLKIMQELGDRAGQGRACGNLGNTHYLLGNFREAIRYHTERLKIAREFGDKAAERRAHTNLGNSHIFSGEFEVAAEHYKKTLGLAQELGDRVVEAQACYSLGNTYTLLRDYPTAIEYHMRHLHIAQELSDRVGEGRGCWSLGNAHAAMGDNERALHFATKHLDISKELGDQVGQATAQMNVSNLQKLLGVEDSGSIRRHSDTCVEGSSQQEKKTAAGRRKSMEMMDLLKLTPDAKSMGHRKGGVALTVKNPHNVLNKPGMNGDLKLSKRDSEDVLDDDDFFEQLSRVQSKRMDDQRCSLSAVPDNKENSQPVGNNNGSENNNGTGDSSQRKGSVSSASAVSEKSSGDQPQDDLLDMIAGMQSKRMDEQRAELPQLPGLKKANFEIRQRLSVAAAGDANTLPDDNFFEMLMRCQGTRIEDQRSSLPAEKEQATAGATSVSAPTVPDEDFFSLIMRLQSGRLEDQRAPVPFSRVGNSTSAPLSEGGDDHGDDKSGKGKLGKGAIRKDKNRK